MNPELGLASAMFTESLIPALAYVLLLVGGFLVGIWIAWANRSNRFVKSAAGRHSIGLATALCVILAAAQLLASPLQLSTDAIIMAFLASTMVSFWNESGKGSLMFSGSGDELVTKMKLEVRPDEDMTVMVMYSARDGSFKNREIFSAKAEKGKRYKWEIEIPPVSGTATVYLVTGEGASWAGEKDYEFPAA